MSCFRGAAQGEGLGNAFLSNISAVDGIFHVLRTFEDPEITHVEDRVDPVEDMHIIHGELRAKDIERVDKFIDVRRFSFRAICADTS
jgi:obg-like ATPase 1